MRKMILIGAGAVLLMSCSRSVLKSKSVETHTEDSVSELIDTSKTFSDFSSTKITRYGDTLSGSMYFLQDTANPVEMFDSIESQGIKIRVGLQPVKGGFKARINAVAKPLEIAENNKGSTATSNGISKKAATHKEDSVKDESKNTDKSSWESVVAIIAAISIVCVALYFISKKFL